MKTCANAAKELRDFQLDDVKAEKSDLPRDSEGVSDMGSISPLILLYFVIIMASIFAVANLASCYVARKELTARTEGALAKAAQELDEYRYYYGLSSFTNIVGSSARAIPINCSDASRTFRREIEIQQSNFQNTYFQNTNIQKASIQKSDIRQSNPQQADIERVRRTYIVSFNCDGENLSAVMRETVQLPFQLPLFDLREFTNEVKVSIRSIYI